MPTVSTATPTTARPTRTCSRRARVFGRPRTEGRDNLAALANTQPRGANYVRHFITNHVIEPSPGGAIGRDTPSSSTSARTAIPGRIALGGRYDDEYVKTPQGWKFKTRTFTPSRVDVQPPPPRARAGAPGAVSSEQVTRGECEGARGDLMRMRSAVLTAVLLSAAVSVGAQGSLTPQDRAEIQELTARYARALGACAAEEYADLFAPDTGYFASNIRGEVVGRDRLMALVRSERHCTTPPRQCRQRGR